VVERWADAARQAVQEPAVIEAFAKLGFEPASGTPEEFARGSLPGAQHTPGGQLMQALDQYVGVRGARLVLFDADGTRAPTVASWLRQMGHDASVLAGGLESGLALAAPAAAETPEAPPLGRITAQELAARLE
ncbi:hypothetical protein HJC10_46100, partial [Corallococcus exiguus]|nr:hypothetical protein [Corallococcus exiguus]